MNKMRLQSGISLVEILVALVISLFLLGGIVQVYLGNKTTYRFTNALSEVQENGRFAMDTLSQDLRQIGHWGCIKSDSKNIVDQMVGQWPSYQEKLHDFLGEEAIEGTDNDGLNGSDSLTIRGSKPGQSNVTHPFPDPGDKTINIVDANNITDGDIVLVMHCGTSNPLITTEAEIIHVSSTGTPPSGNGELQIRHVADRDGKYKHDATVIELQTVTYSVQTGESGDPALFRSEFGVDEELIEGVHEFQVLYGIDTSDDGYPNQYVSSDDVGDYARVVTARIMLLVGSTNPFVTETQQNYTFNGNNITAADNRLYQVFSTTIALRNRVGS